MYAICRCRCGSYVDAYWFWVVMFQFFFFFSLHKEGSARWNRGLRYLLHFCCISWRIYNLLEKVQHWKMIHQTRFNLKQESSSVYVFLFGFNVAFNNFSVILQWCLGVTGRSILTLSVASLKYPAQTHDVTFCPVTLYWHRADQFRILNAEHKRKGS